MSKRNLAMGFLLEDRCNSAGTEEKFPGWLQETLRVSRWAEKVDLKDITYIRKHVHRRGLNPALTPNANSNCNRDFTNIGRDRGKPAPYLSPV